MRLTEDSGDVPENYESNKGLYKDVKQMSLEEILSYKDLDAVCIETEYRALTKYALMAAEKGLHIQMDKPGGIDGDEPLPNECHICNIKLSCLNLLSNKSIRLLGFQKEHLKNISLSDITLKHKIGAPLTVEYADNVVISSFRSDNEECEILTENCTKVYLDGKTL